MTKFLQEVRATNEASWVVPWLSPTAAILNFAKMSITLDMDKDILHQIIWEDASRPCGDDHVTNSQNRKLIRVTS